MSLIRRLQSLFFGPEEEETGPAAENQENKSKAPTAAAQRADEDLRNVLMNSDARRTHRPAGAVEVHGLDEVRAALGDKWEAVAKDAAKVAEAEVANALGKDDRYYRKDAVSFIIFFADLSLAEAKTCAEQISERIREHFAFIFPKDSKIEVDPFVTEVETDALLNTEGSLVDALLGELDALKMESDAEAERLRVSILSGTRIWFKPAWNASTHSMALNRCVRDTTGVSSALQRYRQLVGPREAERMDAELDLLTLTRAIARLHKSSNRGEATLVIPISLSTLTHYGALSEYKLLLENIQQSYRKSVCLEILGAAHIRTSQAHIKAACKAVEPYVEAVLLSIDSTPAALKLVPADMIWGVTCNLAGIENPAVLRSIVEIAEANGFYALGYGAQSFNDATTAASAGFDFICGSAIHLRADSPKGAVSLRVLQAARVKGENARAAKPRTLSA